MLAEEELKSIFSGNSDSQRSTGSLEYSNDIHNIPRVSCIPSMSYSQEDQTLA
jgi:hypothetical protein